MTATVAPGRPSFVATVGLGGLIVGILDGLDAIIFYGITPGVAPGLLFQNIASALVGPRAFHGGWRTAVLGVLLHFLIAFGAAMGYYVASLKIPALVQRPFFFGSLYGLLFYVFMYHVVIPLSALPPRHGISWPAFVDEIFAHIFLVGLPVALMASWSSHAAVKGER
jgi:uncharacterized membrane protein YagU involved in acid resistance